MPKNLGEKSGRNEIGRMFSVPSKDGLVTSHLGNNDRYLQKYISILISDHLQLQRLKLSKSCDLGEVLEEYFPHYNA